MPINLSFNYSPDYCLVNEKLLLRNTNHLLRTLSLAGHSLSILFVDDEEIKWINNNYRQKDSATNVLSFPFADGLDEAVASLPIHELGDIFISIDTAFRESIKYKQSFHDRLTWLITHGILHLIGYDHERSEKDEQVMLQKEQTLLEYIRNKRKNPMTQLAINVDHVATIRQARGITEPDPVAAASICEIAGAAGIVVHLREDRRHIQDRDVRLLRETIKTKMNLEMGANKEIIKIALDLKPDMVTLVPEKREELTTEGGLDVAGQRKRLSKTIDKFNNAGIPVSLFIDPVHKQIKASKELGATFVEIHTGAYCDAPTEKEQDHEFNLIANAAEEAFQIGLRVNAGHGLDYHNTAPIAALDTIEELSIGHAIISRAVISGLDKAVRDMKKIIRAASK